MKAALVLFLLTLTIAVRADDFHIALSPADSSLLIQKIDTFLVGDVNGDKIRDTAFIYKPILLTPGELFSDCLNNKCDVTIRFSCAIDSIYYEGNIGGQVLRLKDLNKDGNAEILVVREWFIGCWTNIVVYSYQDNTWKSVGTTRIYWCNEDDEDLTKRVRRKGRKSFIMIGEENDNEEGKIVPYKTTFKI